MNTHIFVSTKMKDKGGYIVDSTFEAGEREISTSAPTAAINRRCNDVLFL